MAKAVKTIFMLLEIKNLHASAGDKEILKGLNLSVKEGEIHAIMGPNGSGKSTLSAVLSGNPAFTVTQGTVRFKGMDLLSMTPEDRSREGLFLSFQYPVEIPGVSMVNFMRTAINEHRKYRKQEAMNASDFLKLMREKRHWLSWIIPWPAVRSTRFSGEKSATKYFRWPCSIPYSLFSTRPTAVWI